MNFKLFLIFFKIGMFTLGGGPAMIPLVQSEVVNVKKLISEQDFLDSVAFASGLPGAIIINLSVFVGDRVNGIAGAMSAAFGAVAPAYMAILVLATVFDKISGSPVIAAIFMGIRPTVIVLIGMTIYSMAKKTDYSGLGKYITLFALIALAGFKIPAFTVLIIAGISGLVLYSTRRFKDAA